MDEKIKELAKRIFNLEKDNIVQYELLKEFHYELFKIKMNLTVLNWFAISYILYQVINYIWGK
nr:MAG TPA: hemolysin [Caudoviricetes sp.]